MRPLIQQLVDRGDCDRATVLVVGAGGGTDLPLLRRLSPSRLILAEAHPEQAEALSGRIDPVRGEEVWSLAITAEPLAQASLHVVNNPTFSSLKAPTGLLEHFPNLREVRQATVPARSLAAAIEALALEADADHLLVLDAPGQAVDMLGATPPQALQAFSEIVVRCSLEPLYDGDKDVEEVLAMLRKIGFEPGNRDPEAIFPQTAILFARNEAYVDKLRLETQLARARADCDAQAQLAAQRAEEIDRLKIDHDRAASLAKEYKAGLDKASRLAADRDAELEKATQLATEQQKLVADRDELVQKLIQKRDALAKLAADRDTELEKATQLAAEQQKLVAGRDEQIQKLTQERDAQVKLAAEQVQKLMQERDEQAKLVAERQTLLDKASSQNQGRGARIIELEREQARFDRHQAWLDQEVIKAEAQVELIKDILFRDKAP